MSASSSSSTPAIDNNNNNNDAVVVYIEQRQQRCAWLTRSGTARDELFASPAVRALLVRSNPFTALGRVGQPLFDQRTLRVERVQHAFASRTFIRERQRAKKRVEAWHDARVLLGEQRNDNTLRMFYNTATRVSSRSLADAAAVGLPPAEAQLVRAQVADYLARVWAAASDAQRQAALCVQEHYEWAYAHASTDEELLMLLRDSYYSSTVERLIAEHAARTFPYDTTAPLARDERRAMLSAEPPAGRWPGKEHSDVRDRVCEHARHVQCCTCAEPRYYDVAVDRRQRMPSRDALLAHAGVVVVADDNESRRIAFSHATGHPSTIGGAARCKRTACGFITDGVSPSAAAVAAAAAADDADVLHIGIDVHDSERCPEAFFGLRPLLPPSPSTTMSKEINYAMWHTTQCSEASCTCDAQRLKRAFKITDDYRAQSTQRIVRGAIRAVLGATDDELRSDTRRTLYVQPHEVGSVSARLMLVRLDGGVADAGNGCAVDDELITWGALAAENALATHNDTAPAAPSMPSEDDAAAVEDSSADAADAVEDSSADAAAAVVPDERLSEWLIEHGMDSELAEAHEEELEVQRSMALAATRTVDAAFGDWLQRSGVDPAAATATTAAAAASPSSSSSIAGVVLLTRPEPVALPEFVMPETLIRRPKKVIGRTAAERVQKLRRTI